MPTMFVKSSWAALLLTMATALPIQREVVEIPGVRIPLASPSNSMVRPDGSFNHREAVRQVVRDRK